MKIVHVPFSFPPDPIGGTEVYVEALARQQQQEGFTVIVAAPAEREAFYSHDGIDVRRFPVSREANHISELYGEGDALAAERFGAILESEHPDVVHLHALTRGVSLLLLREAKRRGIYVVFSYHTPTVSCQRGTLLRFGTTVCDGTLDRRLCSACTLNGLGLHQPISTLIASLPSAVGRIVDSVGLSGSIWTAIRMSELTELRHATFRSVVCEVDHIVALCSWVKDLLRRNGVAAEKITLSRQGLCQSELSEGPKFIERDMSPRSPLRVIFLGRIDPTKGIHILIEAVKGAPDISVEIDIYGIVQSEAGAAYLRQLRYIAKEDSRISFHSAIPTHAVVSRLREYDVLAVPSQWLETGPLVVLEAFAAGLPVIGSNLGGIMELVSHGTDGLLVEPGSVVAWSRAIRFVAENREVLAEFRRSIRPPRRMQNCVEDLRVVYRKVVDVGAYA